MNIRKYLGNYLGIVVMNTDPEKRGRIKIWVPHVGASVYENWNEDKLDKNFIFPDKTMSPDLAKVLPELKRILPWAECAMPLFGGNAPGRYMALDEKGSSSDSNYWKDDNYVEGKRPSEMFKSDYPDAFTEVNNVGNRFTNPHSHQYKPSAYSNLARGLFSIPNVGAHVWVFFQDGDPKYPVYFAATAGEEDWKRIYTLNQSAEEDLKDFGAPDYPQSAENVDKQDTGFLNTDTKTFRSKIVFNTNKHSIELIDTDLREILKFTHFSGSFLEFNNFTTTQLAAGNDQKLVTGDQFLTVKKNQSTFVQDHVDQIIGGDHFITTGQFDKAVVLQIKAILKEIHDRKRLFEIKRSAATVDDNGTCGETFENATGVSPLQSKSGGPAPCPTCCGGKVYHIVYNECDTFSCASCSTNVITPGVHIIEDKTGSCGVKWVLPCKTCCGAGVSPSTQDGAWAADGLKQGLAGFIQGKQAELFPLQRLLGNGGNEIATIHGNKTETIGQVFNDFEGWRKDPTGKIRVCGVAVDHLGTYEYMRPAPIVESVDVDHLPGGDYHITASNQYRLLVGGGGVQIKTFGNIDMYAGIISIAGEQLTLSSKGEVLVNGKERTSLQGKHIAINPDDYGQAVVNGGLGVTRQFIVNGATHLEGELYVHHITAPLEYQTTECADSLKCATLAPCIDPIEFTEEIPVEIEESEEIDTIDSLEIGGMVYPIPIFEPPTISLNPQSILDAVTAAADYAAECANIVGAAAAEMGVEINQKLGIVEDYINETLKEFNDEVIAWEELTKEWEAETKEWGNVALKDEFINTSQWNWLDQHWHVMPHTQHFHYFKNVPLDLWCKSEEVRKDACDSGINDIEQLPSKVVKTPSPNACNVPTQCYDLNVPCAESPNMPPMAAPIP